MQFRTLTFASALALMTALGPATAAENEGQIARIDRAENRIMLDDGTIYQLAPSTRTSELAVGDRVQVTRDEDGYFRVDETTIVAPAAAGEPLPPASEPYPAARSAAPAESGYTTNPPPAVTYPPAPAAPTAASPARGRDGSLAPAGRQPQGYYRAERENEGSGVVDGIVTDFDRAENRITLNDGRQFEITPGQRPDSLHVGSRVRVAWQGYEKGFKSAWSVTPLDRP